MTVGYGVTGHLAIAFQSSWGTLSTTSMEAVPITDESVVGALEQVTEAGMYGRFEESPYHEGAHSVGGDINMESEPSAIGFLFKSAMNISSTSDTGKVTHVFVPRDSDFDDRAAEHPFTIEAKRRGDSKASHYWDCQGNQLTLNIANGELLTVGLSVVGADFKAEQSPITPTFPTGKPFIWDSASLSWSGNAIQDIRDLTITINNNIALRHTLSGSKAAYRAKRDGFVTAELTGTVTYATDSMFSDFRNQSEVDFTLHFAGQESPHALTFKAPNTRLTNFEPTMAGQGVVEASFTARALFDASSDTSFTLTLVNSKTYDTNDLT